METQATYTNDPCPKGIVNQLLDIAKENDAMSEIGGATGWRWQEGIISRMPKTKTVARILKKAYGTEDPNKWFEKTSGDLRGFVKKNYSVCDRFINTIRQDVSDVYEAYFLSSIMASGVSQEEVVYGLCYLKFAKSLESDDEYCPTFNKDELLALHSGWAQGKLDKLIKKFQPFFLNNKYVIKDESLVTSESFVRYHDELSILRNKMVGFNSTHDMWRIFTTSLTDEEHVEFEIKMSQYFNQLTEEIRGRRASVSNEKDRKIRSFSFNCLTMPSKGEVLK